MIINTFLKCHYHFSVHESRVNNRIVDTLPYRCRVKEKRLVTWSLIVVLKKKREDYNPLLKE